MHQCSWLLRSSVGFSVELGVGCRRHASPLRTAASVGTVRVPPGKHRHRCTCLGSPRLSQECPRTHGPHMPCRFMWVLLLAAFPCSFVVPNQPACCEALAHAQSCSRHPDAEVVTLLLVTLVPCHLSCVGRRSEHSSTKTRKHHMEVPRSKGLLVRSTTLDNEIFVVRTPMISKLRFGRVPPEPGQVRYQIMSLAICRLLGSDGEWLCSLHSAQTCRLRCSSVHPSLRWWHLSVSSWDCCLGKCCLGFTQPLKPTQGLRLHVTITSKKTQEHSPTQVL